MIQSSPTAIVLEILEYVLTYDWGASLYKWWYVIIKNHHIHSIAEHGTQHHIKFSF